MTQAFLPSKGYLEHDLIALYGRFDIGAVGAVAAVVHGGTGFTLTRTGVGLYTIQLTCKGTAARVSDIVYADVQIVGGATTVNQFAHLLTLDPAGATITFEIMNDAGTAVAELANPSQVMVALHCKTTSIKR